MGDLGLAWGGGVGGAFSTCFRTLVLWARGPWDLWAHGQRPLGPMGPIFNTFVNRFKNILFIELHIELPIELPIEL